MPVIENPMRLGSGQNDRGHPIARARKTKQERHAVGWLLRQHQKPAPPCVFKLTRISPSHVPMDSDNLVGAFKATRDAIAEWVGVNDRHDELVRYECRQERGPWGIRIEWSNP